jgi:hypothetical protein
MSPRIAWKFTRTVISHDFTNLQAEMDREWNRDVAAPRHQQGGGQDEDPGEGEVAEVNKEGDVLGEHAGLDRRELLGPGLGEERGVGGRRSGAAGQDRVGRRLWQWTADIQKSSTTLSTINVTA